MFVQDSWQVTKRLNFSLGLRYSQNWGDVKGVDGTVFKTNRLAPRLGFTFDILGDKSTILKAHYGQFTEAMLTVYHDRMNPSANFGNYIGYLYDPLNEQWDHMYSYPPRPLHHGPRHQAPLHDPVHGRDRARAVQEHLLGRDLHQPEMERSHRALRYLAASNHATTVYSPELDEDFTVYERTLDTLD